MPYSMTCNGDVTFQNIKSGLNNLNFSDGTTAVVPKCSTGWVQVAHVPPFDSSQIDPSVVTALFGAGFLLYLTPWAVAWGLTQLVKAIR